MTPRTSLTFVLALIVTAAPLAAQTAATKDPQAIATVQNSIAAQGGLAEVSQITNAVVSGMLTPTQGSPIKAATFVWEDAGRRHGL